jgi:hypothetical protein
MTDQTAPVTPRTKPHPCVDCANDPTGRGICAEHLELAERSTAGTAETPRAEWGPCDGETCRCHWPSICPDCGCTDEREAGSTDALLYDAGPAGIDVERLAEFFHEEYWAEANEPHWPREQADATDCEVCWSSAAKLHARLSHESDR